MTQADDAAIPAATLILVRDRAQGTPELLMVERAAGMAFAAGAMVFPGGRIDAADRTLADAVGSSAEAVAAVRETIEETGIAVGLTPPTGAAAAQAMQDALVGGEPFDQLLRGAGITFDDSALIPFARWVPTFHAVRRFDTLFLLARAPDGEWSPRVIAGECAGAQWIGAADVLAREAKGTARLIFPTRRTLERVALHSSFDELAADARAHPIVPITPWIEERGGERFITIPSGLGFPITQEPLDGLWRG